jgi:ADP-ribosyl-[dinitrogen reductase] hydrolase
MSLCIAQAIDLAGGWDLRRIADRLVTWMRAGPVDIGSTVRKGLRRILLEGTLQGQPADGDGGNGAAMRMVPVALASACDAALLARWTLEQARLTHHHPLSDAGTLHVGELVQLALVGGGKSTLLAASDRLVASLPVFKFVPYRGQASGYVVDTLQTVLHAFYTTGALEDCVVKAVNQGGDADTTGAIAGAIAGAYYGEEQLPPRWLKRLDKSVREEIVRLCDRLVDLSPLARGEAPTHGK